MFGHGGMRTNEATSLRIMDVDFTTSPTTVYIRNTEEHRTKTKETRFTFISDEAAKYLKGWIAYRYRTRSRTHESRTPEMHDQDLMFADRVVTSDEGIYDKLRGEFNKILAVLNKGQKKDGQQRRKITLNSFRRFAKTTTGDQVNTDFSEWFIGHANSSYWTKKEPELKKIYAEKCMKYLTFLDYTVLEATGKNIEGKLEEKEKEIQLLRQRDQIKDQELQSMKDHIQAIEQSQRQSFEEFKQENRHIIAEAMAKFTAQLPKKALDRFHKPIKEILAES